MIKEEITWLGDWYLTTWVWCVGYWQMISMEKYYEPRANQSDYR
jgi:hypothetical protein